MIAHAKNEYPNEACGILAGKTGNVEKAYKMANADKSPESYLMDPKEQFSVMKDMRKNDWELLGIYHSHVASPARPSATDIEMAFYPDAAYLIISLSDMDKPVIRSFSIKEGKFEEIKFEVER
ncbi:MAG: M67 family metallopeptidase [Candidatus Omnitrophica bacterium]|nr:M67 family metallopeptidase [Candidatus Omnitrophota bacterium]